MAKMFEQLGKTMVHIGVGEGKYIEVKMLPLADYDIFRALSIEFTAAKDNAALTDADRVEMLMQGREKMIALAKKVMPLEMHENLARMDVVTLSRLLMVLCTGEDDGAEDAPEKKITLPSQLAQA